MIPTVFGLIVLVVGLLLLRRNQPLVTLAIMLAMGLFEASAAISLPALSGSTIPPARVMLGFVLIQALLGAQRNARLAAQAIRHNLWFIVFCFYGFIAAFILPRIFAGAINVTPMNPQNIRSEFDVFPLAPSPQNVTTAFYLIGSGLTAVCAWFVARQAVDIRPVVRTAWVVCTIHATLGIVGVVFKGTAWDVVVDAIRNGNYAQLDQSMPSFVRINGIMAEPSNYARFGFVWFVFCFELWLRDIAPRRCGPAAALMGMVLLFSTSSTAYVSLAIYSVALAARAITMPRYLTAGRLTALTTLGFGGGIAALAVMAISPSIMQVFSDMVAEMTVGKISSASGQQRAFWARQGLAAFSASMGLGVGPGSFRSSGLAQAIIGSMGVVGSACFAAYVGQVLVGVNKRELEGGVERISLAHAAAWTACIGVVPLFLIHPSPDPGMEFAALAGLALGLREKVWRMRPALSFRFGHALPEREAITPEPAQEVPLSTGWRRRPK